jgi:hypothetical protein
LVLLCWEFTGLLEDTLEGYIIIIQDTRLVKRLTATQ